MRSSVSLALASSLLLLSLCCGNDINIRTSSALLCYGGNGKKNHHSLKSSILFRGGSQAPIAEPRIGAAAGSIVVQPTPESLPSAPSPAAVPDLVKATSAESSGGSPLQLHNLRLIFLFFYACLGSLLPYLPVYYHSLGLSGPWIGFLGAVNPMTTFLVGPLWGAAADRYNSHKAILLFTLVASVMARLLMLASDAPIYLSFIVFVTAFLNAPVKPLLDSSVSEQHRISLHCIALHCIACITLHVLLLFAYCTFLRMLNHLFALINTAPLRLWSASPTRISTVK